jgi:hypothetical protein
MGRGRWKTPGSASKRRDQDLRFMLNEIAGDGLDFEVVRL